MPYKMLVLDMDDTLLTDDYQISARNKSLLMQAQEKGVYVVLASGRPTPAMTRYAEELELARFGSYMISYNGGCITSLKEKQAIFEQTLALPDIKQIYDFSQANKTHILSYINGVIVSETTSPWVMKEVEITGLNFEQVPSFLATVSQPVVKCILLEEPSYLKQVETVLKSEHPQLSVSISKPFFLEVTQQGIDKAASLARLAAQLKIDASEIIAVGNAHNDLSMIEYAGLGVWVDNVTPELRPKAQVVVASNNDDGVAEVVERFILG
jgi:Cof subfamily protein (haloacid dehalogenase superfamily)